MSQLTISAPRSILHSVRRAAIEPASPIDPAPDALRSDSTIVATTSSSTASSSTSSTTSLAIYFYGNFNVLNPDGKLLTYMTAQVRIVLGSAKGALTIPTSAVSAANAKGERSVDVIAADDSISSRLVTTGLDDKVRIEVLTGLKEGERVVASRKSTAAPIASAAAPGGRRTPSGGL